MFAPHFQLPAKAFRPFAHSRKPPVSGTNALIGNLGINFTPSPRTCNGNSEPYVISASIFSAFAWRKRFATPRAQFGRFHRAAWDSTYVVSLAPARAHALWRRCRSAPPVPRPRPLQTGASPRPYPCLPRAGRAFAERSALTVAIVAARRSAVTEYRLCRASKRL